MIKRIFLIFLVAGMVFLSGCQLAQPEAGGGVTDRLAGVLVTTEYLDLFDMEAYFNDHAAQLPKGGIVEGDTQDYQGRLYGQLTPMGLRDGDNAMTYEVSFPVEGWYEVSLRCSASGTWASDDEYYWWSTGNGGFYDTRLENKVTDQGQEIHMELQMAFCREGVVTLYANPVYQTSDGQIYVTSGSGISADLSQGGSVSQTLTNTVTARVNGKEETNATTVLLQAGYARPTESLTLVEMDENNEVLGENTYKLEDIPQEITLGATTAYLIVQTSDGAASTRTLCDSEDTSIQYFTAQGDLAWPQYVQLHWREET